MPAQPQTNHTSKSRVGELANELYIVEASKTSPVSFMRYSLKDRLCSMYDWNEAIPHFEPLE